MRRARILDWVRMRRSHDRYNDVEPSSPPQSSPDYTIVIRGYNFREGQVYAASSEKGSNAVVTWPPIDIGKIISLDIERLKAKTMSLRPAFQKRIKSRFPGSRVDARSVGQHSVEIEDRAVKSAPV